MGPCVLVTGGTGLVGGAVVDALAGGTVVSLSRHGASGWAGTTPRSARAASSMLAAARHGHVVAGCSAAHVEHVHGDVTDPRLGLRSIEYERLAARVDVVVHAAGVTDYTTPRASTEAVNVSGTRHVARFAERAQARLVHVSTGYVGAQGSSVGGRFGAGVYLEAKRKAELIAAECGTLAAIVRPSLVFGHSIDGSTPSFQGLHRLVGMVLDGRIPLLPFGPETRVDFLPRDLVGATIARLALDQFRGEFWLTAGTDALAFGRVLALVLDVAAQLGRPVEAPRFVSREMIDRLLKPVGGPVLARRIDLLLALTSHLGVEPLPSSLAPGERTGLERVLQRGMLFWVEHDGLRSEGAISA